MKRAYYLSREDLDDADEITMKLAEEVSFLNKAAIKKNTKKHQTKFYSYHRCKRYFLYC